MWHLLAVGGTVGREHLRRSLIQTNDMFAFLSLRLLLSSLPTIRLVSPFGRLTSSNVKTESNLV
jgi:hypothetical protein